MTELFWLATSFLLTFLLYKTWPTFVAFVIPDFDFYASTNAHIIKAFGQVWCLLLFLTNSLRQIWLHFKIKTTNIILLATCVFLLIYLFSWHQFIGNSQTAFMEDGGLMLYPPLSALGDNEYNIRTKERASIFVWTLEVVALIIGATALLLTIYRRKSTRA